MNHLDEADTYDSLNQLTGFDRNSGDRTQAWDFDALGNWDSLTTDGGSPQTRTHNKQNEITAVSGATSPTFDANGNMTTDETGKQYVYDAWNRLKVVKNSGGTTLKTYVYDALNRRVAETASGATTDFYYSADWQVLEERDAARTNDVKARYVWSPVYVDAMVLRDRDTADDGTLEERLWVQQDANFNVTALVDNNGDVVERYVYDPYGVATVLDETWSVIGSSAYGWLHLHQGGRLDATSGLYHFRNRDYSPTLGRWVTMDPIGYQSGDHNIFRYMSNSTATARDPLGLLDSRMTPGSTNIRFFTGVSNNGSWNNRLRRTMILLERAFGTITEASLKMDRLYNAVCVSKGTALGAELSALHSTFLKYFNGGDKCPDCSCMKSVKETLAKIWRLFSDNTTFSGARRDMAGVQKIIIVQAGVDPRSSTIQGSAVANQNGDITVNLNDASYNGSMKDQVGTLLHELSHALANRGPGNLDAYYESGSGSAALYWVVAGIDKNGKKIYKYIKPTTEQKCNHASSIENFIMEIGYYYKSEPKVSEYN